MESPQAGVLIVEDDADLRDCLREELEEAGYRVLTASNGREGLEVLDSTGHPCLILLDLMMPIMTGYEFLAVLRDRNADIPVVVMSAFLESNAVPERTAAILPKPFRPAVLLELVGRYC